MRLKSNHDKTLRLADGRALPARGEIFVPDAEWASLQHDTLVKTWLGSGHVETVADEAKQPEAGQTVSDAPGKRTAR